MHARPLTARPLTVSVDLEDHRRDDTAELRFPDSTRHLLEALERWKATATFFVVGTLAEAHPELVREVADRGHEIALHGWEHVPLGSLGPDRFRTDVAKGKALLEDLTGTDVVGFRAPTFSLTAGTPWAPDVLGETGFRYSSSVLPAANPLFGYPGAPLDPFRWTSGLVEFPVPIAGLGPAR